MEKENKMDALSAITGVDFDKILNDVKIDSLKNYGKHKVLISIVEPDGTDRIFATAGNLSMIKGAKKSRKTGAMIMLAGTVGEGSLFGKLKYHSQKKAAYYDTEQHKIDVAFAKKRVDVLGGGIDMVDVFTLREIKPFEKREFIFWHIQKNKNLYDFAIIDGISDLLTSVNDEKECNDLIAELMRISSQCNVHITCVLHTKRGTDEARGWIGTILENKVELTTLVKYIDENYSEMHCESSRRKSFSPITFGYDENVVPYISGKESKTDEKIDSPF